MTSETRNQFIGAATLVFLVVLMVVLNRAQDGRGASDGSTEVTAIFGRIDGLTAGDDVRMGGVKIGTVRGQTLDQKYRARVTLALDPGAVVPKDSSASIQTDGLFGGKFVVIEPGAEEALIKSGNTISRTQDAQVVGDLLDAIISEGRAAIAARKSANPVK